MNASRPMLIRFRAAACGGRADSGTNCGPPPGGGCGPPIAAQLIHSKKPAAERTGLLERTCGTRRCSPPPGGGCGLRRLLLGAANSAFTIQDSKLLLGQQLAEGAHDADAKADARSGPSRGGGCGPLGPDGPEGGAEDTSSRQNQTAACFCPRLFVSLKP